MTVDIATIDATGIPIDGTLCVEILAKSIKNLIDHAVVDPSSELGIDRNLRAASIGQIHHDDTEFWIYIVPLRGVR